MEITLRPATMDDAELLLRWKNEEDTRKNSIVTDEVIKMENHLKWLEATLLDWSTTFRIILLDGVPVGDVRTQIQLESNMQEISIRMDKQYRGMGLATQVIAMFNGPLLAKIRAHNIASMRVFIANGYRPEKFVDGPAPYYIFRK
jgi:RimJ/RimL family protein N-acetyltransferase